MTVHWFPGHMAKALRLIEEQVKIVDFVIECRDARAPISTRNPVIDKHIGEKPRLIILTKKDLAETKQNELWVKKLEAEGNAVILVNSLQDNLKQLILSSLDDLLVKKREREVRRGMKRRKDRALIVGVPNVGKSTIINRIGSRKAAAVENRPGVTQALKLVQVSEYLELVDTPGVLWSKFESKEMGLHCALIGSVKHTGFPLDFVVNYGFNQLSDRFESFDTPVEFFEDLGEKKGLFAVGGEVEMDVVKRNFLLDLQNGKYGQVTWDRL